MDWVGSWPAEFQPVIRILAGRLGFKAIWPKSILGGASGARTYLAAPESKGHEGLPNQLILKLGPKNVIDEESAGLREARLFFKEANYCVENTVDDGNGIGCIPMLIAGDAQGVTFAEF